MAYLLPPEKKNKNKSSRHKAKRRVWVLGAIALTITLGLGTLVFMNLAPIPPAQNNVTLTPMPLNLARIVTSTPAPASTSAPQPTLSATQPTSQITIEVAQLEQAQAILALVNADRTRLALNPLTLNPILIQAARIQSLDMAQGDFMSHTGSDNSDVSERVKRVGYGGSFIGENILQRWDVNAEQAYQQWWNSPPHQANMLNADFVEIGIGFDIASSGRVYYAMVLGSP